MDLITLKTKTETPSFIYQIAEDIKNGGLGNRFLYCLEDENFYIYDDNYWRIFNEEELLFKIELNYPYLQKFTPAIKNQILAQLRIINHKHLSEFNKLDLLNFKEGMFQAKGNNLISHNYEYYSTMRLPYKYDGLAVCPLWIKTINEIFENNQDKIQTLQEFMGYCLTRDVTKEKAMLLLGDSRSGKSTILNIFNYLLGDNNVSSVSLENLSNPQYTAMMVNKIINIDWDVASGAEKFETNFKIITSGEPVSVNEKYIKTFIFRPYCKFVMAANKFPRITDTSSAFYKRLILLPCDRVFETHEQDLQLKNKLKDELSGIFNWAFQGYLRLERRGNFEDHKEFMTSAIADLREESNPIEIFFKEFILTDVKGNSYLEKTDLYNKYSLWCKNNGNAPLSSIKFNGAVYHKYKKFTPKNVQSHTNGKRIWRNLKYNEMNINNIPNKGWNNE